MLEPFYQGSLGTIYNGDALKVLKALPDGIAQMCMTSPPYWGLRNYAGGADIVWGENNCQHKWGDLLPSLGQSNWHTFKKQYHSPDSHKTTIGASMKPVAERNNGHGNFCTKCGVWRGQLGLEPDPELYVEHLMMIFREVKRVLRKDGSFYLNIGDTYGGSSSPGGDFKEGKGDDYLRPYAQRKLSPKCMVCIPERVLFAVLEDGWILRNKIIWHKRNYMPGSQKDRFSQSWEYLYFFTKARKYYFDLDAVRVPHKTQSLERYQRGVNLGRPAEGKSGEVGPMQQYIRAPGWFKKMFPPDEDYKGKFDDLFGHGPNPQSFNLRVRDVKRGKKGTSAQDGELKVSDQEIKDYEYPEKHHGSSMSNRERLHRDRTPRQENINGGLESPEGVHEHPKGKNPGNVWSIATKPSAISVCPKCETVFPRLIKVCPNCKVKGIVGHFAPYPEALCIGPIKASSRVGDIILDIFAGGGTTGIAAKRLGRQAILIDCVKPYCIMARYKLQRIEYQPEIGHSNENG